MQFLFSPGGKQPTSSLLFFGLLSLAFGFAILIAPALVAYLIAAFFIVTGISLLQLYWRTRR